MTQKSPQSTGQTILPPSSHRILQARKLRSWWNQEERNSSPSLCRGGKKCYHYCEGWVWERSLQGTFMATTSVSATAWKQSSQDQWGDHWELPSLDTVKWGWGRMELSMTLSNYDGLHRLLVTEVEDLSKQCGLAWFRDDITREGFTGMEWKKELIKSPAIWWGSAGSRQSSSTWLRSVETHSRISESRLLPRSQLTLHLVRPPGIKHGCGVPWVSRVMSWTETTTPPPGFGYIHVCWRVHQHSSTTPSCSPMNVWEKLWENDKLTVEHMIYKRRK